MVVMLGPTRSFACAVVRQLNKAVKHAVRQPWLPCFLADFLW